jgi:hypothetical protein
MIHSKSFWYYGDHVSVARKTQERSAMNNCTYVMITDFMFVGRQAHFGVLIVRLKMPAGDASNDSGYSGPGCFFCSINSFVDRLDG